MQPSDLAFRTGSPHAPRPSLHSNKLCPVRGCDCEIPPYIIMCREHWERVPKGIRADVNAARRAFDRRRIGDLEEAYALLRRFDLAAAEAIAAAARKNGGDADGG